MNTGHLALGMLLAGLAAGATGLADTQTRTAIERTVYVTATNQSGTHVADLTAADVTVKEGGKDREILRVERSRARLKVCLAIDQGLSPDADLRRAAFRFIEQLHQSGEVALYLIGRGNAKLVDYTSDLGPLLKAINEFPLRAQGAGNLVESLYELAKSQRSLEGRRVIVILTTENAEHSTVTANGVLDELRNNGTALYAATLVGPIRTSEAPTPDMPHLETTEVVERDRVLNDGTRQSGGLRLSSLRIEGFPAALDRIRGDLLHQYEVTYVMPAGSKSDGRVSIATRRKGVTVRGPNQVPKL
jgi:VWFA-related protein